jgi:hypothetical protein
MRGVASIVPIARYKKNGRVIDVLYYVVIRRIGVERTEVFGVIDRTVFVPPSRGMVKFLVTDHIEEWRDADHRSKELGPLCQNCTDQ